MAKVDGTISSRSLWTPNVLLVILISPCNSFLSNNEICSFQIEQKEKPEIVLHVHHQHVQNLIRIKE